MDKWTASYHATIKCVCCKKGFEHMEKAGYIGVEKPKVKPFKNKLGIWVKEYICMECVAVDRNSDI